MSDPHRNWRQTGESKVEDNSKVFPSAIEIQARQIKKKRWQDKKAISVSTVALQIAINSYQNDRQKSAVFVSTVALQIAIDSYREDGQEEGSICEHCSSTNRDQFLSWLALASRQALPKRHPQRMHQRPHMSARGRRYILCIPSASKSFPTISIE